MSVRLVFCFECAFFERGASSLFAVGEEFWIYNDFGEFELVRNQR